MTMSATERQRLYRERHPERVADSRRKFREKHQDKLRVANRERERTRRENAKRALLEAVGGACKQCGFSDPRALHIDHVHDDGSHEDPKLRLNTVKYQRHVLAMLAEGKYQILCANCNHIKEWERRRRARKANQHPPHRPEAGL